MVISRRGANRDIADGYPNPIALTYVKIYQDSNPTSRHERLRDLFQVTIQFMASILLSQYARDRKADPATYNNATINGYLATLARPSMGNWVGYLRSIVKHYDEIGKKDQLFLPQLAEIYNKKGGKDLYPAMLAASNMLRAEYESQRNPQGAITIGDFIDRFVTYRNRVMGHGTARNPLFYSEKIGFLLPALEEMLDAFQFLTETPLVYIDRAEFNDRGDLQHFLISYSGTFAYEQMPFVTSDTSQRRLPRQLYLARQIPSENNEYGLPALVPELSLHPLIILTTAAGKTDPEVFMLGEGDEKVLKYMSYASGATTGEGELRRVWDSLFGAEVLTDGAEAATNGNGAPAATTRNSGPAATNRAVSATETPAKPKVDVDELKKRLQETLNNKLWDQARQQTSAILEAAPEDKETRQLAERLDMMQGLYNQAGEAIGRSDWEHAAPLLDQLYSLNAGYRDVADLSQQVKRGQEAAQAQRVQMVQQLRDALMRSYQSHLWEQALHDAEAVIKLDPNDTEVQAIQTRLAQLAGLYTQANSALKANNPAGAIPSLEQLASLEPDYRDVQSLLQQAKAGQVAQSSRQAALAAFSAKRWDEAGPLAEKALQDNPRDTQLAEMAQKLETMATNYQVGKAAMQAGQWSAAHDAFARVRSIDPGYQDIAALTDEVELAFNREQLQTALKTHDWDEARQAAAVVSQLAPSDTEARATLDRLVGLEKIYNEATAAIQTAAWFEAREELQRLVAIEPAYRDADALVKRVGMTIELQIGALRSQLQDAMAAKRWDEAQSLLQALQQYIPDDPEARQIGDRLAMLQDMYTTARAAINRKSWVEARALLRRLDSEEPGYRDLAMLLNLVQSESDLAQAYAQAKSLLAARQWQDAYNQLQQIRAQRANYEDVAVLIQEAEKNLTRTCPKCGTVHPYSRRFCNRCGTDLSATPANAGIANALFSNLKQAIVDSYPAPVATTYARLYQEMEPAQQHARLDALVRASVEFMASVVVLQYIRQRTQPNGLDSSVINMSLTWLNRPSITEWATLLHDSLAFYQKNGKQQELVWPQLDAEYNQSGTAAQYPAMLSAYTWLRKEYANDPDPEPWVTPATFLDAYNTYRNTLANRPGRMNDSQYQENLHYLVPAVEEMLLSFKSLATMALIYVMSKETTPDNQTSYTLTGYTGTTVKQLAPLAAADGGPDLQPQQLYLAQVHDDQVVQPLLPLYPFVIAGSKASQQVPEIFLLDWLGKNENGYINYASGVSLTDHDSSAALTTMLNRSKELTEKLDNQPTVVNNQTRKCPKCGTIHPITRRFCNVCGTNMDAAGQTQPQPKVPAATAQQTASPSPVTGPLPMVRRCPRCGTETTGNNRFCVKCGTQLPPLQQQMPAQQQVPLQQQMPAQQQVPPRPATRTCAYCGTVAQHGGKFCLQCGKPLPPLAN